MRISDWSSDVCSSDLVDGANPAYVTPWLRRITRRAASRETQPQRQSRQGDKQHGQRQHHADLDVVTPGNPDLLACQHLQPEQRGQAADRGELRPAVTAYNVGLVHRLETDNPSCREQV